MFDNIASMRASSKSELAKTLVMTYRNVHGISINKEWIYTLIRGGIYRDSDGSIKFGIDIKYTIDELCSNPSLARNIKV